MLDKFVITLISPLGSALALSFFALVLALFKKIRLSWILGLLAVLWLWGWSLPVVSYTFRHVLESQFPPLAVDTLPNAQAIVVLGGAMRPAQKAGQVPDLRESADRVWHAARLFHAGKAPLILLSGGSGRDVRANPEAAAMRAFLADLGVASNAMVLEGQSSNTRQNAQFTADLLRPQGVNHILLVTSALHMRRAVALFEAQGFAVTPAATDHEAVNRFDWDDYLPDASALDGSARAIKEIIGRMASR